METTYNGWKNYQTWVVNLWLNNEPYSQDRLRILANTKELDMDSWERGQELKDRIEAQLQSELGEASMFKDLLGYSLEQVDWREIIESNKESDYDA